MQATEQCINVVEVTLIAKVMPMAYLQGCCYLDVTLITPAFTTTSLQLLVVT